MFTFVQAMEGVDFKEALKILAQKAGVELVVEDLKKRTERERWYAALYDATVYYVSELQKMPAALEYLENRGVTKATLTKWQIGYAPGPPAQGWRMVKEELEKKGYTKDELFKVGLIKSAEGGKEPYDVFRDRIMFPMNDQNGKVVAFSGRILSKDTEAPKYVNSPETELYKKSELLFGYDKAKHGIRNLNFSLIVEGQFDVVMAHQAGYGNTVAVSGTALTLHHVQLLERLSDRVVLALDADKAGIAAMKRAADLMLRRGIDVKVAEMPLGEDPADIIRKDAALFKQIVGKSVHVIEFLLHVLIREEKDPRTLKRKAKTEIFPFVLLLPDRIEQDHFEGVIANALGITKDAVHFDIERLRTETNTGPLPNGEVISEVLKQAVDKPDAIRSARLFLEGALTLLEPAKALRLQTEIEALSAEQDDITVSSSEVAGVSFSLEQQFANVSANAIDEEIIARLNQLRTAIIKRKLAIQKELLKEAEANGDNDMLMMSLESIKKLEQQRKLAPYHATDLWGKPD